MRILICLSVLSFAGCASSGTAHAPPPEIERTDTTLDLSGKWNDVDADLVAQAIIRECLSSTWIEAWTQSHEGHKPVLRLYPIRNRTVEYIDYQYFTKQIEHALVNSGKIDVVSSVDESEDARMERSSQAEHASDETIKSHGNETGSDFILNGWILSQDDQAGNREVRAYLTSIEIIEVETQKKAWVGQKRIRKLITHAD